MTFDEFLDISASQDFLLKEGSIGSKEYVFENSKGDKLYFKRLSESVVTTTIPAWTVELNGDRVIFSQPAQLLTINTVITGLVARSIKVAQEQAKNL